MIFVSLSKSAYAEARRVADLRHKPRASSRILSPEYEFIGVVGELAFGLLIGETGPGFRPDFQDGGVDFKTAVGTIDVKGNGPRVRDLYVVADRGPLKCDLYVLVSVRLDLHRERPPANVVGFAHQSEVKAVPPVQRKTLSHVLSRLHPIEPLVAEIRRAKGLDPC